MKRLLLVLASFFLFLVFSVTAFAQAPKEITNVILGKSEVIDHNYYAAGKTVTIDGTINGDAYVAGGQVELNGTVNGDLMVAGGQVDVNGTVTGDLISAGGQVTLRGIVSQDMRAAGGNILILGTVGKNVSLAGGNITLDKSSVLGGNGAFAGGNIGLYSPVKNLTLAAGNASLNSEVLGSVTGQVGALYISQNAKIDGDLEYWSPTKATLIQGAVVSGKTIFHQTQAVESMQKAWEAKLGAIGFVFGFISFVSSLVLGLILLWILPVFSKQTAELASTKFFMSLITGFVALVVTPVLIVLLLITLIGIPISMLLLFAFILALFVSKIFVVLAVGKWVFAKANWKENPYLAFILGLILYYILGAIPVFGGIIKFMVVIVGLGALLLQKKYYFVTLRDKKLI